MKFKFSPYGFTFLEPLVVIIIIGLLATIVLVSLKGVSEKARISKPLEFSQTVHHVLGAYPRGVWKLNECENEGDQPSSVYDSSGYNNQGENHNGVCKKDTPFKVLGSGEGKWALEFHGSGAGDDYIKIPGDPSLGPRDALTLEVWFKIINWPNFNNTLIGRSGGGKGYQLRIEADKIPSFSIEAEAVSVTVKAWDKPIRIGKWNHVVGTWDGEKIKLYVNGQLSNQVASCEDIDYVPNSPVGIAANNEGWNNWGILIEEAAIYSQALSLAKIKQHFAKNLKN